MILTLDVKIPPGQNSPFCALEIMSNKVGKEICLFPCMSFHIFKYFITVFQISKIQMQMQVVSFGLIVANIEVRNNKH